MIKYDYGITVTIGEILIQQLIVAKPYGRFHVYS